MLKQLLLALCFAFSTWAASLQWNASVVDEQHSAPTGYRIHRGTAPGAYDWQIDVGLALQWPIPDDLYGTYYWAVSAYNEAGPSGYSNEVNWASGEPAPYIGATNLRASRYQIGSFSMATFGLSSGDADWENFSGYCLVGRHQYTGANGTLTALRVQTGEVGNASGRSVRLGVYQFDTTSNIGTLLLDAGTVALPTTGLAWAEITGLSLSVTQNAYYGLAVCQVTATTLRFYYSAGHQGYVNETGGDLPESAEWSYNSNVFVMQADVTEGGGASAVKGGRGNLGIMRGMSRLMWLENDFLKPIGGQ